MAKTSDRGYYLLGLRIVGDFGATIAIPVVAFTLFGKWLDGKWGTGHFYLIVGFVASAALTALLIVRKAKAYGKEYQKLVNYDRPPDRG
jgi:hypothetical protein